MFFACDGVEDDTCQVLKWKYVRLNLLSREKKYSASTSKWDQSWKNGDSLSGFDAAVGFEVSL